jgi:hypothetical protein
MNTVTSIQVTPGGQSRGRARYWNERGERATQPEYQREAVRQWWGWGAVPRKVQRRLPN